MIRLSTSALAAGVALAFVLVIVANVAHLPEWAIYMAFVAIIAIAAWIATEGDRVDRGMPPKHGGAGPTIGT